MLFSPNNRLLKAQVTAVALICLSNLIVFIALLTPAWQVSFSVIPSKSFLPHQMFTSHQPHEKISQSLNPSQKKA